MSLDPGLFDADHAPGALTLTASRIPALVLPEDARPSWMPSPYALALHMLGVHPLGGGRDGNAPEAAILRRGRLMEPVGARMLAEDYGIDVYRAQERITRDDIPALAYLDLITSAGPVELKTVNSRDFDDAWAVRPPLHVRMQAQAQMMIGGFRVVMIGAIVMGYSDVRLELFEEPWHDPMQERMLTACRGFLSLLRRGSVPHPDYSESSYDAWAAAAPLEPGSQARVPGEEAVVVAHRLAAARAAAAEAEKVERYAKAFFAAEGGDAETLILDDGTRIERAQRRRRAYQVQASTSVHWRVRPPRQATSFNEEDTR